MWNSTPAEKDTPGFQVNSAPGDGSMAVVRAEMVTTDGTHRISALRELRCGDVVVAEGSISDEVTADDEFERLLSMGDGLVNLAEAALVLELNAPNAALAVVAWKRMVGFYATGRQFDHGVFVVETGGLHREGRRERETGS